MPESITITLNGEPATVPAGSSVSDLIASRNLKPDQVAVEVNRRLRRTADYDRPLEAGDAVELVTFVGGG